MNHDQKEQTTSPVESLSWQIGLVMTCGLGACGALFLLWVGILACLGVNVPG